MSARAYYGSLEGRWSGRLTFAVTPWAGVEMLQRTAIVGAHEALALTHAGDAVVARTSSCVAPDAMCQAR